MTMIKKQGCKNAWNNMELENLGLKNLNYEKLQTKSKMP